MISNIQNLEHHFYNFLLKKFPYNTLREVDCYFHKMEFTHITYFKDYLYYDHSKEYKFLATDFMDYRQQINQFFKD
jgi:hypothetical protein